VTLALAAWKEGGGGRVWRYPHIKQLRLATGEAVESHGLELVLRVRAGSAGAP